jgi:hypothetical protein
MRPWENTRKGLAEYKKLYNFASFNSTMTLSGTMLSSVRLFTLLCLLALVFLSACVERYFPNDLYLKKDLLVINAHITDEPGTQTIEISRSAHPEQPSFNPELGCYVILLREDGESREFRDDAQPGYYTADLDPDFLRPGILFQVQVVTADGNEYHSDFDKIRPAPPIDSIYYEVEYMTYDVAKDPVPGIRFYIDFTYDDEVYEYLRWELTETYEFHNPYTEAFIMINRWTTRPLPEEDNPRICYITRALPATHSLSTNDLEFGSFQQAFDFVPNDQMEQKLLFKYSLLVRQYSLGPEAYYYWEELGKNSQEQGVIFTKQPALIKSNICNIADENEKVLGFFTMSGVQEARGIASDVPGPRKPDPYYCLPVDKGPGTSQPTSFPAFFARATYDGATVYEEVSHHCVDCREYRGSTNIKPDYW